MTDFAALDFKKTVPYLEQSLTRTLPELYKVEYDELWGLDPSQNLHQAKADLPLGLEQISAWMTSDAGKMAALYDGLSDDIPVVELEYGSKSVKCAMIVMGMHFNLLQVEKERLAQSMDRHVPSMDSTAAKQRAVGDYLNRRAHHLILWGDVKSDMLGMLTLQNSDDVVRDISPYVLNAGEYVMTSHEIFEWFKLEIFRFMQIARVSSPSAIEIILPPHLNERLCEIYVKPGVANISAMTVKKMLMSSDFGLGINKISVRNELQGSHMAEHAKFKVGGSVQSYDATKDRMIMKVSNYNPIRSFYPRRTFPLFQTNTLRFDQMSIESHSAPLHIRPNKIRYVDFKNKLTAA